MSASPARQLQIGDVENAIRIIASSQTDPQKAVAELIENSLDAGANRIKIVRRRKKGSVMLRIADNGRGLPRDGGGKPDFAQVATRICDSHKRKLSEGDRKGIHGQYGIGLLGFWAIGERLRLVSTDAKGTPWSMEMARDHTEYEEEEYTIQPLLGGCDVYVVDVHEDVQRRLGPERLAKYLGDELRGRLQSSSAEVIIEDHLPPKKTLTVRPQRFEGEPLTRFDTLTTPSGSIRLDLHLTVPKEEEQVHIGLYKDGTRVLEDICEVPELNHAPWNMNRLTGAVDFPAIHLAPTSRRGVHADEQLGLLVAALRSIEKPLRKAIDDLEDRAKEEADKKLVEKLEEAFNQALAELSNEYSLFGTERGATHSEGSGGKSRATTSERQKTEPPTPSKGPLARVEIRPRVCNVVRNGVRNLAATALDPDNRPILEGVSFGWSTPPDLGGIQSHAGPKATFAAGREEGVTSVTVVAELDGRKVEDSARIVIVRGLRDLRLPPPLFVYAPRERWRSRWNSSMSQLQVNSGHEDWVYVRDNPKRKLRYIGFLYGKELVLHNFEGIRSMELLEHMVEIVTHLDSRI